MALLFHLSYSFTLLNCEHMWPGVCKKWRIEIKWINGFIDNDINWIYSAHGSSISTILTLTISSDIAQQIFFVGFSICHQKQAYVGDM